MRFAHISDTHLGYRQYNLEEREEDFYAAFGEAVDRIIEERCDFVLHCGDLFEEPRPHIRAMLKVQNALDRLEGAGIDFYAITGNHDRMVRRGSYPPHTLYKRMKLLTIDDPTVVRDDTLICGLPYIPKSYVNVLRDKLDELKGKAEGYEKAILMLHQGVDKYIGFETAYELKIGDIPRGFDYYAMGHIHLRRVDEFDDGKLVYPGSTEVWRVDELGDYEENGKGFYIVDTKHFDIQKIDLESIRPHFTDAVGGEGEIGRIKQAIAGERSPVLHLKVAVGTADYAALYRKLTDEFRGRVLYLDLKRMPLEEKEEAFGGKAVGIRELLEEAMRGRDRTDEEIGFAYELFLALSEKDIEKAVEAAEEFYNAWSLGERGRPSSTVHEAGGEYKAGERREARWG
ncbi:MAG: metallophosphoesterase [Candidatus Hydrothermarchaeaceae archaeon]